MGLLGYLGGVTAASYSNRMVDLQQDRLAAGALELDLLVPAGQLQGAITGGPLPWNPQDSAFGFLSKSICKSLNTIFTNCEKNFSQFQVDSECLQLRSTICANVSLFARFYLKKMARCLGTLVTRSLDSFGDPFGHH